MSQYYDPVLQSIRAPYYKVLLRTTMQLRHSCLVVVAHEKSSTLSGASYGMERTWKDNGATTFMSRSRINETSSKVRGETYGMQNVIYLLRLPRKMTLQPVHGSTYL